MGFEIGDQISNPFISRGERMSKIMEILERERGG